MTRDEIIRMAREVADPNTADVVFDDLITLNFGEMERFAALVAAAEREACAQVCRDIMDDFWTGDDRWETARHCSEMILERGKK